MKKTFQIMPAKESLQQSNDKPEILQLLKEIFLHNTKWKREFYKFNASAEKMQPSWKEGQHHISESRPQLQTSRKKRL
jgi:hypothetical protein